jgi:hypothetical protein
MTAAVFAFSSLNAQSQVLYANTNTFQGANFNYGNGEVGNQVSLAGTAATYWITNFVFQIDFLEVITGALPTGSEMADLRFYENNGPPASPSGAATPGTVLYDSGAFPIGGFTLLSLVNFSGPADFGAITVVPQNFTWTVIFSGLATNVTAGLALYSPATIGTNYDTAWINDGTNWQLLTDTAGDPPPDFGAVIGGTPVPELQFSANSNLLVLSWPTNAAGFTLRSTTNLSNPSQWTPVSGTVVISNNYVITNTISGAARFYRLDLPVSL